MKNILYSLLFILGGQSLMAQQGIPQIAASRDTILPCGQSCVNISARYLYTGTTSQYHVQQIPYLPLPYNTGNPILVRMDDRWSSIVHLPFSFCFFGNVYTDIIVGSNGVVSFNTANANGFNSWAIPGPVPFTNPGDLLNSIMGPYQDTDPTNIGNIYSQIAGVYPYRYYKIAWDSIPYFGDANSVSTSSCPVPLFASCQIMLYETTNMIDIYIKNKAVCPQWNGGQAIEGIQNATGTVAYTVPGRNAPTQWTAQNDAWRFTPSGPGNVVTVKISDGNQVIDSLVGDTTQLISRQVCPPSSPTHPVTTTYYADVTYQSCGGGSVTLRDSLHVTVLNGGAGPDLTACQRGSATLMGRGPGIWTADAGNPSSTILSNASADTTTVTGLDSLGRYRFVFCTSGCCDTTAVNVGTHTVTDMYGQVCGGQAYTLGGMSYSVPGTYYDTIHTTGCDSVIALHLTTAFTYRYDTVFMCAGGMDTFAGHTYTIGGTYFDTIHSAIGCDTITTLYLLVRPTLTSYQSATMCAGSSYTFSGIQYYNPGTYHDTLQNMQGCDSIATLNLSAWPSANAQITVSLCSGQTYVFAGRTLSSTGIYNDTATSVHGCDSITLLHLTISGQVTQTISASICAGASYSFGGLMHSASGSYVDTAVAAAGCDSVTYLYLTVRPAIVRYTTATICPGGSYTFGAHTYGTAGMYSDSLQTASGCDSISRLILQVLAMTTDTVSATICFGHTYAMGGHIYSHPGMYMDTIISAGGCDSILRNLILAVDTPAPAAITASGDTLTALPQGATYYLWYLNGLPMMTATSDVYVMTGAGSYTVAVGDANGCFSTSPAYTRTGLDQVPAGVMRIYPNPNTGAFVLETNGLHGMDYTVYDMIGQIVDHKAISSDKEQIRMTNASDGIYMLVVNGRTFKFRLLH